MSHLGRPKGVSPEFSLKHIVDRLEELLDKREVCAGLCWRRCVGYFSISKAREVALENLRFHPEEKG